MVTLKTIGNTGMKSFFPEILKILDERDRVEPPHSNIVVVSAIDALRRMRLSHKEKKQVRQSSGANPPSENVIYLQFSQL